MRLKNRWRHWHGRLALRYGRLLEQRTVERDLIRSHARGGKSLLEPSSNCAAIEPKHLRQHPHRLIHRINDSARDTVVDGFRNGSRGGKQGRVSLSSVSFELDTSSTFRRSYRLHQDGAGTPPTCRYR